MNQKKKTNVTKIAVAGLMAALCYAGYALFPSGISLEGSGTKIHIGNTFVVLSALITGPLCGALSGAIGLSLADIFTGFIQSSPRTFITKFMIGLIAGAIAHKAFKINRNSNAKKTTVATITATLAALCFNCVFEPALKYVWYYFLFPNPDKTASAIKAMMAITAYTTLVNTVINSIVAILLYLALRPALIKAGIIVTESTGAAKKNPASSPAKSEPDVTSFDKSEPDATSCGNTGEKIN